MRSPALLPDGCHPGSGGLVGTGERGALLVDVAPGASRQADEPHGGAGISSSLLESRDNPRLLDTASALSVSWGGAWA